MSDSTDYRIIGNLIPKNLTKVILHYTGFKKISPEFLKSEIGQRPDFEIEELSNFLEYEIDLDKDETVKKTAYYQSI
jgi:hypothetical protein